MSHPVIERVVTERSDSEFYAGAPTLEGYSFTLSREVKFAPRIVELVHSGRVVRAKGKRLSRFPTTTLDHGFFHRVYTPKTDFPQVVFESYDVAGDAFCQLSELISELASRPRSYSHNVIEDVPAERLAPVQNQAVAALLALEFREPDEDDQFPHNALSSFSRDEGAEIERILGAGAPDWVRELRHKLGR